MKRGGLGNITTGTIGTYLVAAELVQQGFIVSALSQTAKGIDILAADLKTLRPVAIQVKTTRRRDRTWLMHASHERIQAPGLFYCFVAMPQGKATEFFVVPSAVVARYVRRSHAAWLKQTRRDGVTPHRDNPLRLFRDVEGVYRDAWRVLRRVAVA